MPSAHPNTTSFPRRASVGSWLRSLPSGVRCSSSCANAPMHRRSSTALCTAAGSGGSGRRAHTCSAEPGRLSALTRMTSCCKPTRRTSGSVYRLRGASLGKRWNAIPGRTRPARPRRCFAAAALTATSSSEDMSRSASYRSSLTRPVSMTHTTSSMVMEVSATFVDKTTFTFPGGGRWNTRRWSSGGSAPCSGSTHSGSSVGAPVPLARPALCAATATRLSRRLSISLVPGRKIRIAVPPDPAPPSSFSRSAVCAVPRSQRSSRAAGIIDSARSTSPPAASTNQRTSSQMSCWFTTSMSSCARARHAARARVWLGLLLARREDHSASESGRRDSSFAAARPLLRWFACDPWHHSACLSTQCLVVASASSRCNVATGNARPGKLTRGAPSKYRANTSPSIVADISPIFTVGADGASPSPLALACAARSSISLSAMSRKSPSTVRSCTSSTSTCVIPARLGSRSSRRSSTPVVQNSRRVSSQTLVSPRMA
mmetsp:Transcript_15659/g.65974  ORF Transcript_15659/g.65974 Transcript_15659/m.65974 type:complete len:488 (+) Transcript_15659:1076-2539(+)